jgi:hypothetical protein
VILNNTLQCPTAGGNFMIEFKALHIADLTEEVAKRLDASLQGLPGIQQFTITLVTQELYILFDEKQLSFQTLARAMAEAGCPLRNINAAVIK